jgi:hypothetical protein
LNAKVLQNGTPEAIFRHLSFVESLSKNSNEAEVIELLRRGVVEENGLVENPALSGIIEKITRPTTFESFDTSRLTEEQYNSLRLCATYSKDKQQ